jgi:hypothetical protein
VQLKASGSVKAKCLGRSSMTPIYDLVSSVAQPPVRVELTTGPAFEYCAELGGTDTKNGSDGRVFLAKGAPAPASCD